MASTLQLSQEKVVPNFTCMQDSEADLYSQLVEV